MSAKNSIRPIHITEEKHIREVFKSFRWESILKKFSREDSIDNPRIRIANWIASYAFNVFINAVLRDIIYENTEFHFLDKHNKPFLCLFMADVSSITDKKLKIDKRMKEYKLCVYRPTEKYYPIKEYSVRCTYKLTPRRWARNTILDLWKNGHDWESTDLKRKSA